MCVLVLLCWWSGERKGKREGGGERGEFTLISCYVGVGGLCNSCHIIKFSVGTQSSTVCQFSQARLVLRLQWFPMCSHGGCLPHCYFFAKCTNLYCCIP